MVNVVAFNYQGSEYRVSSTADLCTPSEIKEKLDYLKDNYAYNANKQARKMQVQFDFKHYVVPHISKNRLIGSVLSKKMNQTFRAKHKELKKMLRKNLNHDKREINRDFKETILDGNANKDRLLGVCQLN